LCGSCALINACTRAIASKAASAACALSQVTSTKVPSSGRQRMIRSAILQQQIVSGKQAINAIGDMPARQSRARYILDIASEFERDARPFADELRAPALVADLAAIGFAIFQDLHAAHRAIRA